MKTKDRQAASRRMKGRFSSRLSNRKSGGRHKSFRAIPEYYRLAIESLKEYALLTMDKNLQISGWSGPAAEIFGYAESEIIGRNVALLFTPEDIANGINRSEFAKALANGREDDERWHVRKDGSRIWCYGLSFPLKDEKGVVRGFVKLIRDDTERKRKDDLLRENEERLTLAAESTGIGTWDYNVADATLKLSKRAAELFGLGTDPESPGFEQFLEMIHPEDRPRIAAEFIRCLAAGGSFDANLEYRIEMPGGAVRWVLTRARGFYEQAKGHSDKPDRLIGTVIDITDRKRRQAEAQELKEELEIKVRERTEALTSVNKELETFAYSASHDLRAPVRKISAFTQAILESGESKLSPTDQNYFDRIRAAAAKMEKLIDDILGLARATQQPISVSECDLSEIARRIAAELKKSDPARRVDFVIADEVPAQGDRELLTIAMRNLLENAWKFTSTHAEARVEFGMKTENGVRVYFVKDDGAGFDPRFAHKMFGAFQRLHPEEDFEGTGVGLGMVERIVRRHRGRIWAEGGVEQGACFFFTLGTENA